MKRMFRSVVAAVVCAFLLASAAWGRDNRFRFGHPDGDDPRFFAASARSSSRIILIVQRPIFGTYLPWVIITSGTRESSPIPLKQSHTSKGTEVRR